jgi:hypothetical protein
MIPTRKQARATMTISRMANLGCGAGLSLAFGDQIRLCESPSALLQIDSCGRAVANGVAALLESSRVSLACCLFGFTRTLLGVAET